MTVIDPRDYPGATCHRPPRDPHRRQMQASPNDHAGHPLPSGVRQARQHRDRRSTTTSLLSRRPTTGPCQSPSAQRTLDIQNAHCRCLRDRLSLRLTANFPGAGRDVVTLLHSWSAAGPARTGGRTAVSRDHTADRRIEQAAVGWCGDPQLRDHESLGVLFLLARLSTVAVFRAGGSLRIQDKGPGGNVPSPRRAASPGAPQIRLSAVRLLLADGQMDSRRQLATLGA
jgi:hypothetical protein